MPTISLKQNVEIITDVNKPTEVKITDGLTQSVATRSATLEDAFNLIIALQDKINILDERIKKLETK